MAEPSSSRMTVTADKSTVIKVLADFASYPEWAGGLKEAEVVSSYPDGQAERVSFLIDAGPVRDRYSLCYEWAEDRVSFALAESGSVIKGLNGTFRLAESNGGTEVSYELSADLKIPMMNMFGNRMEKMILQNTLKDLKKRVDGH